MFTPENSLSSEWKKWTYFDPEINGTHLLAAKVPSLSLSLFCFFVSVFVIWRRENARNKKNTPIRFLFHPPSVLEFCVTKFSSKYFYFILKKNSIVIKPLRFCLFPSSFGLVWESPHITILIGYYYLFLLIWKIKLKSWRRIKTKAC